MVNENLVIGVHSQFDYAADPYSVIESFTKGLIKGFQNNGAKAFTTQECIEKGITPNVVIGFNKNGQETWQEYLNKNIPNIMWSTNSIFNDASIDEFTNNPNFILFNVSSCDNDALAKFYPNLKHTNFPHAVDLDLWKKQDCKKEYDAVLFASVIDCEAQMQDLKLRLPKVTYDFIMDICNIWTKSSNASFWQVNELLQKENNIEFPLEEYRLIFSSIADIVSSRKKIQLIKELKNFNVKIFGNGPWSKYVEGNVEYNGTCSLNESIDIMNKSKIVLHSHPQQTIFGLHERILNASAVEAFVLSTQNAGIISEFGKNMDYFEANFENAPILINYYLKNGNERRDKARNAHKIVSKNHTWDIRAKQVLSIID